MKKLIPIVLAIVAFFVVLLLLTPPAQVSVAVAAVDLSQGHVITVEDLVMKAYPKEVVPLDAVTNPASAVGMTMMINRSQGDMLRQSSFGVQLLDLQPDERAVAINVDNASGFAGLLRPGDRVGISAIISMNNLGSIGTYSKATVENLRVLYLSPEFKALDPNVVNQTAANKSQAVNERKQSGVVILAVSTASSTITYDFSKVAPLLGIKNKVVNAVELLTALNAAENTKLSLYLMPLNPKGMTTSGLWVPDLVILPYEPTPTISINASGAK